MNGSRAVNKQILGEFWSVSHLPFDVLCNKIKFGRNIYNYIEMYKEETNRQTHSLLCRHERRTDPFFFSWWNTFPVTCLWICSRELIATKYNSSEVRAAYFTVSSSRRIYFSFFPLVISPAFCKITTISQLCPQNYDRATQWWINLFHCTSPRTLRHTRMEVG
jgi:hypothetical protein